MHITDFQQNIKSKMKIHPYSWYWITDTRRRHAIQQKLKRRFTSISSRSQSIDLQFDPDSNNGHWAQWCGRRGGDQQKSCRVQTTDELFRTLEFRLSTENIENRTTSNGMEMEWDNCYKKILLIQGNSKIWKIWKIEIWKIEIFFRRWTLPDLNLFLIFIVL